MWPQVAPLKNTKHTFVPTYGTLKTKKWLVVLLKTMDLSHRDSMSIMAFTIKLHHRYSTSWIRAQVFVVPLWDENLVIDLSRVVSSKFRVSHWVKCKPFLKKLSWLLRRTTNLSSFPFKFGVATWKKGGYRDPSIVFTSSSGDLAGAAWIVPCCYWLCLATVCLLIWSSKKGGAGYRKRLPVLSSYQPCN